MPSFFNISIVSNACLVTEEKLKSGCSPIKSLPGVDKRQISIQRFLIARETSPDLGFIDKNNLKFSCGEITRGFLSSVIIPHSVKISSPPISINGLRRSSTEDGQ